MLTSYFARRVGRRPAAPDQAFEDANAAFAWLGVPKAEAKALLAQIDALREAASGSDVTLTRVRETLASRPCATLDELAKRLAMSRRSCQRALSAAGTSFRKELRTSRLRRARDFLAQDDRSLTWIAAELGYTTVQHFTVAFRSETGQTPSAWRARHRKAGAA